MAQGVNGQQGILHGILRLGGMGDPAPGHGPQQGQGGAEQAVIGGGITGLPTGFVDLDRLLSGLQPNALIIVGAVVLAAPDIDIDAVCAALTRIDVTVGDLVPQHRIGRRRA